jgi:hypothetical protein
MRKEGSAMNDDSETAEAVPPEVTCSGGVRLRLGATAAPAPRDEEAAAGGA